MAAPVPIRASPKASTTPPRCRERHRQWGALVQQGVSRRCWSTASAARLPQGFRASATSQRPDTLNEVTVRPLESLRGSHLLCAPPRRGGQPGRAARLNRAQRQCHLATMAAATRCSSHQAPRRPAFAAPWRSTRRAGLKVPIRGRRRSLRVGAGADGHCHEEVAQPGHTTWSTRAAPIRATSP